MACIQCRIRTSRAYGSGERMAHLFHGPIFIEEKKMSILIKEQQKKVHSHSRATKKGSPPLKKKFSLTEEQKMSSLNTPLYCFDFGLSSPRKFAKLIQSPRSNEITCYFLTKMLWNTENTFNWCNESLDGHWGSTGHHYSKKGANMVQKIIGQ